MAQNERQRFGVSVRRTPYVHLASAYVGGTARTPSVVSYLGENIAFAHHWSRFCVSTLLQSCPAFMDVCRVFCALLQSAQKNVPVVQTHGAETLSHFAVSQKLGRRLIHMHSFDLS